MEVQFSKQFIKDLAKQPRKTQALFFARLTIFIANPADAQLHNHRLKGKLKNFYSINVTGDVRALYEIIDGKVYIYQMIGSHAQLY